MCKVCLHVGMDTDTATPYAQAWAKAIAEGRKRGDGMTRTQLAKKLDVTYQAVQNWETGRAQPSPRYQAQLYGLGIVTAEELSAITLKAAFEPRRSGGDAA